VFVTPQGDVVDRDGMVTGGDGRALDHGLLARRTEMEEVAARAAAAGRELREAEEALPGLRAAAAERAAALAAVADAVRDAERAAFERDVARQQKVGEAARIDAAAPVGAAEIERLGRAAAETAARRDALEAELAAAAARRRDLEAGIQAAAEAVAAHRAALEESRRAAAGIAAEVAAGMEKVAGLRREGAALGAALAETRAALDLRRTETGGWQERVAGIRAQADALGAARRELQARRADAAARDEAQHAGLAYERSLLHAREQGVRERRQAHADRQTRAQERAVERARLEARLDGLAASCRDELGTTLEALRDQGVPADAPPPETLEPQIEKLRVELDGIGPVNLMAIDQHGELEERFGFLSAQKADLEESVASLQETIRRINRQSRERFREAFEAIQGYFLETFRTLFGGGRAELRLQDDEDVLEAGVEIVAQPPGKRLQKIALLSGGEKALTAAALLFSLFRYRPSPFCVLDEVDAPLDEANVERFTGLLKALRAETQFILITHNRKSMEAADLLYGVTMEEAGVSKVLPLRFE
jgi:chromosome segregation protein